MTRLTARLALAASLAAPLAARAQQPSAAASPAAAQPAGKTPNLSGTWELNAAKSQLGPEGASAKGTLVMTQSGDKVTRQLNMTTSMGAMTNTMHYTIGAASTDTVSMGGQSMPVTSTARWEAGALVIDGKISMQGMEIPVVSRYTLSPDGKQLTQEQTITTPVGERKNRTVYDKKS